MRHLTTAILVCVAATALLHAQPLSPLQQAAITSGATGKEFWIAIPPNEITPFPTNALEIYISSAFDTEVEVYDAFSDRTIKKSVAAGTVITLSEAKGNLSWASEIREYEAVSRKGIRLTADKPIAVSVLNAKVTSSDAYLAVPVVLWGTSYIVTSYYDFKEFKPWAGGFTIVAGEDGTQVSILLRGTGELVAKTSGGKTINTGTPITITMNAGDTYTVVGDGATRGVFDLTGTSVTSTKPIGLISFHQRSTMPNVLVNGNGRDHLVEMNVPVSQWDTTYATIEIERNGTNPSGRGDLFRVIAAENNTQWTMTSYDLQTKQPIETRSGMLAAGGFAELDHVTGPSFLPSGLTIWKANKPIQVVQYSCSSTFDGSQVHDPFQINLLASERFTYASVFQVPTHEKFSEHYLNVVVKADPTDAEVENNLKSITLDGTALWNHTDAVAPGLLESNITGTDIWWTRIRFGAEATSHTLLSPSCPFGGYLYGLGSVDSYGLPLGPIHPNLIASDSTGPLVDIDSVLTGRFEVRITETLNDPSPPREKPLSSDQVDAGIAIVSVVAPPVNMRIVTNQSPGERRIEATLGTYTVEVIDTLLDGSMELYALDYAGNVTTDTIVYTAPTIILYPKLSAPDVVDLGETGVDTAVCASSLVLLRNIGDGPLSVSSMELADPASPFWIDTLACPLPIDIEPGKEAALTCICFTSAASGSYTGTLRITANDQEAPHEILLQARVREPITVGVGETAPTTGASVDSQRSGSLHISYSSTQSYSWKLYTLQGVLVGQGALPAGATSANIPTGSWGSGLYLMRIETGEKASTHRVML